MELTSRPQPLIIARVFTSLAPTIYLNMYSFGRHDKSRRAGLLIACASRFAIPISRGHMSNIKGPDGDVSLTSTWPLLIGFCRVT